MNKFVLVTREKRNGHGLKTWDRGGSAEDEETTSQSANDKSSIIVAQWVSGEDTSDRRPEAATGEEM